MKVLRVIATGMVIYEQACPVCEQQCSALSPKALREHLDAHAQQHPRVTAVERSAA